jgi:hypothetical protein
METPLVVDQVLVWKKEKMKIAMKTNRMNGPTTIVDLTVRELIGKIRPGTKNSKFRDRQSCFHGRFFQPLAIL